MESALSSAGCLSRPNEKRRNRWDLSVDSEIAKLAQEVEHGTTPLGRGRALKQLVCKASEIGPKPSLFDKVLPLFMLPMLVDPELQLLVRDINAALCGPPAGGVSDLVRPLVSRIIAAIGPLLLLDDSEAKDVLAHLAKLPDLDGALVSAVKPYIDDEDEHVRRTAMVVVERIAAAAPTDNIHRNLVPLVKLSGLGSRTRASE